MTDTKRDTAASPNGSALSDLLGPLPEDALRQQAFSILSPLQSGTEDVVRLDAALAAVAAERERWLSHEVDILAAYSRTDGRREWVSVGTWLRRGEVVALMAAPAARERERGLKELRDAVRQLAALNAWHHFGDCRAWTAGPILSPLEADELARQVLRA